MKYNHKSVIVINNIRNNKAIEHDTYEQIRY